MRRTFSHRFALARCPEEAIHLFTPRGEEAWVPGWQPCYLHPSSGETACDMVFTTGTGDDMTIWTCLIWAPEAGHARYLRTTPVSRLAFVDVRCTGAGPGPGPGTTVTVSYEMHALTAAGCAEITAMTQAGFARMIDEWPRLIAASTMA